MKIGRKMIKKTAGIATKFLFITVFTKAVKRGIIKGTRSISSRFKRAKRNTQ